MTFKDRAFSDRFNKMGDEAEGIFEAVYPEAFARYGLQRPPVNLNGVPAFVRYTPDYFTNKGLVEVQGFGRDQTFKLKVDKYEALRDWEVFAGWRVDLFVWDSANHRYGFVRLADLTRTIALVGTSAWPVGWTIDTFPEGKEYYAIKAECLPVVEWVDYEPGT